MANLLLDASVLIEAERSAKQIDALFGNEDDVAIAAVTAAELLVGVELADERRRPARHAFVRDVLGAVRTVDYDLDIAQHHARLLAETHRLGKPRGAHDLIVAATARATGRAVVTYDAQGFEGLTGVDVLGP